jgi:hypothetical protein
MLGSRTQTVVTEDDLALEGVEDTDETFSFACVEQATDAGTRQPTPLDRDDDSVSTFGLVTGPGDKKQAAKKKTGRGSTNTSDTSVSTLTGGNITTAEMEERLLTALMSRVDVLLQSQPTAGSASFTSNQPAPAVLPQTQNNQHASGPKGRARGNP